MTRDGHLSVRVPADLKATLQRLADASQRTLASYVHHVLHEHIQHAEGKGGKSRKT